LALPTTLTTSEASIDALRTQLASVTAASSGAFDLQAGYTSASTMMASTADQPVVRSLEILTRQGATAPANLGVTARQDKIALNMVGLRLPVSAAPAPAPTPAAAPLAELAKASGGDYNSAKTGAEALRDMSQAAKAIAGQVRNLIDAETSEALAANATHQFTFYKSAVEFDGKLVLTWYFDPADASKLTFFVGKKGTTLSNVSTYGEGYSRDDVNGTVSVVVDNALLSGNYEEWTAEARASAATSEGLAIEVASDAATASNPISLGVSVQGGSQASSSNPVITARFGGRQPIRGGQIKVNVVRASDGVPVLQDVAMLDDGAGADERANDGIYTLSLAGRLVAGDYVAVVEASTVPGTSTFNPNQIQAFGGAGQAAETTIADEIQRLAELDFTVEAGALGVVPGTTGTNAPDTSSGGGCTAMPGQRDASLPLLVMGVAGWLAYRRRKQG
jgi:hypothetical protein